MKIGILVTHFPPKWISGTEIATYKTANYLSKRGNEVHVLTRHDNLSPKNEFKDGFYIHRIKLINIRILGIIFYFISLLKIIKKIKPEVIQAQMLTPNGWLAVFIKKLLQIPIIVYPRGDDIYLSSPLYKKTIGKFIFKNCDMVIALTNNMKKEILKIYNREVEVISNGIELDRFKNLSRKKCRKELGISNDEKIILYIGRLHKKKCVEDLIKALKNVVLKEKNVKLLIVGSGEEKKKLMELVKNEDLEKIVIFIGEVANDKIPKYIISSDIFALVSYGEGYPMVFSEVLASGIPIVTSNNGPNSEIIENGKNGIVVELHNILEIANAIILLLRNKNLREKIYINNINKAKSQSWEIIAKDLEKVYKMITKNKMEVKNDAKTK